jgi:hypothetical protein
MNAWKTIKQYNKDDFDRSLDELGATTAEKDNTKNMTPNDKKDALKNLLEDKSGVIENASVPDIINDKCVSLINTLIIVLLRKGNVFVDFEDDLRPINKKFEHFLDDNTNNNVTNAASRKVAPHFIIRIGSLPRMPLKAPDAPTGAPPAPGQNWIKITGSLDNNPNIEYFRGVYFPEGANYKHYEHNDVIIQYNSTENKWEIKYVEAGTEYVFAKSDTQDILTTTWQIKDDLYSGTGTTFTAAPGTASEIGAPYIPSPGEKIPDFTPTFTTLPERFDLATPATPATSATPAVFNGTTQYTQIGLIYKSIYHDLYYKYYNKPANSLFFDCASVDVKSTKDFQQNTRNMFPFIALYKNNSYNATEITAAAGPTRQNFIYQDIVQWTDYLKRLNPRFY